jgi:hypothetical protein
MDVAEPRKGSRICIDLVADIVMIKAKKDQEGSQKHPATGVLAFQFRSQPPVLSQEASSQHAKAKLSVNVLVSTSNLALVQSKKRASLRLPNHKPTSQTHLVTLSLSRWLIR